MRIRILDFKFRRTTNLVSIPVSISVCGAPNPGVPQTEFGGRIYSTEPKIERKFNFLDRLTLVMNYRQIMHFGGNAIALRHAHPYCEIRASRDS